MDVKTLGKHAQFYCNVRIVSNITLAVIIAVLSLYFSTKIQSLFSNSLISQKAKILSVDVQKDNFYYYPVYNISFNTKDNTEIKTKLTDITMMFPTKELADNFIEKLSTNELDIFYDEQNPKLNLYIKGQEKLVSKALLILAFSLVIFAIISYILLGNSIYCGFVIFRDIFTIFGF